MSPSEMVNFYNQFKKDNQEKLIPDINVYVNKKMKGCSDEEIQEVIDELKTVICDDNLN